jgi:hypothetical protein
LTHAELRSDLLHSEVSFVKLGRASRPVDRSNSAILVNFRARRFSVSEVAFASAIYRIASAVPLPLGNATIKFGTPSPKNIGLRQRGKSAARRTLAKAARPRRQMTFYNLLIADQNKILSTPARDRSEALAIFGKELNLKLTLEDTDTVIARYLLDEWESGPHWVNPTIPVYAMPA